MKRAGNRPRGDTLEEPNVNRPFFAFGMLLAALALAMLAVSSGSRWTTVSESPEFAATTRSARDSARVARSARFAGILVVLPAEDESVATVASSATDPYYASSSVGRAGSVDLMRGEDTDWPCEDVCPYEAYHATSLVVEAVSLAKHDPALLRDETSRDCRSHYDPAYDVLVYGEVDAPSPSCNSGVGTSKGVTSTPVEWSEYADLLDQVIESGTGDRAQAESTSSVRSSRALLDFAAVMLHNTSRMLQFAADELHRVANPVSGEQLAGDEPLSKR
jgi:hypothetical protein